MREITSRDGSINLFLLLFCFTANVVKPNNAEQSATTEKNQIINYVDEDDEDADDDEDEPVPSK